MRRTPVFRSFLFCFILILCIGLFSGCVAEDADDGGTGSSKTGAADKDGVDGSGDSGDPSDEEKKDGVSSDGVSSDELSCALQTLNKSTGVWEDVKDKENVLFENTLWEPGIVVARNIKISNTGTLMMKYQLDVCAGSAVSELADVIDVYYVDGEHSLNSRAELSDFAHIGTLTEVLAAMNTVSFGNLFVGDARIVTLAFKMQEFAGNEYQGKTVEGVSLRLTAAEQILSATSADEEDVDNFSVSVDGADITYDDILPGDRLDGTVSVRNTGAYDQYVRVTVTVSGLEMGDDWSAEELFANPNWGNGADAVLDSVTRKDDCFVLVLYVDQLLSPGESITLYDGILVPTELTREAIGRSDGCFTVGVFAEAVFTESVTVRDAKSAFEYAASKQ